MQVGQYQWQRTYDIRGLWYGNQYHMKSELISNMISCLISRTYDIRGLWYGNQYHMKSELISNMISCSISRVASPGKTTNGNLNETILKTLIFLTLLFKTIKHYKTI